MNTAALRHWLFGANARRVAGTRARTRATWLIAAWSIFIVGAALQPCCVALAVGMQEMHAPADHPTAPMHRDGNANGTHDASCALVSASDVATTDVLAVLGHTPIALPFQHMPFAAAYRASANVHAYAAPPPLQQLYLRTSRLLI